MRVRRIVRCTRGLRRKTWVSTVEVARVITTAKSAEIPAPSRMPIYGPASATISANPYGTRSSISVEISSVGSEGEASSPGAGSCAARGMFSMAAGAGVAVIRTILTWCGRKRRAVPGHSAMRNICDSRYPQSTGKNGSMLSLTDLRGRPADARTVVPRAAQNVSATVDAVTPILQQVRREGVGALMEELSEKFDGVSSPPRCGCPSTS